MDLLASYDDDTTEDNSANASPGQVPPNLASTALENEWLSFEQMIAPGGAASSGATDPVDRSSYLVDGVVAYPGMRSAGPVEHGMAPEVQSSESSSSEDESPGTVTAEQQPTEAGAGSDDNQGDDDDDDDDAFFKLRKKIKERDRSSSSDRSSGSSSASSSRSGSPEKQESPSPPHLSPVDSVKSHESDPPNLIHADSPEKAVPEQEEKQDDKGHVEEVVKEEAVSSKKRHEPQEKKSSRSNERKRSHRDRSRSKHRDHGSSRSKRHSHRSRSRSKDRKRRHGSRDRHRHKDKKRHSSRDHRRSKSRDRKRSKSRDRKRSRSRGRDRKGRDGKRSKSRERKPSKSKERKSSRAENGGEKRRSRSRERKERKKEGRGRHRSKSKEKRAERNKDRRRKERSGSRGKHRSSRSRSRERLRSRSPVMGRKLTFKEQMRKDILTASKEINQDKVETELPVKRAGEPLKPSDLLKGIKISAGESVTPQMALMQTMAAMHKKAQELTGVEVPKYYNPAAVNPLKYAEQVQKRKLLWSKKDDNKQKEKDEQIETQWKSAFIAEDDGKTASKFRKLMGIKGAEGEAPSSEDELSKLSEEQRRKHQELFQRLDQEYQFARITTHTQRGVGLGFSSQVYDPNHPSNPPP